MRFRSLKVTKHEGKFVNVNRKDIKQANVSCTICSSVVKNMVVSKSRSSKGPFKIPQEELDRWMDSRYLSDDALSGKTGEMDVANDAANQWFKRTISTRASTIVTQRDIGSSQYITILALE